MLGRRLDGRDVLRRGQQRQFLRRRNVQHMNPAAGLTGERQNAPGGENRRLDVAQMGMLPGAGRRVEQRLARVQPVFVLGVDGCPAAAACEHPAQGRVVGDQQRTGRTAHEDLDAGAARQSFQRAQFFGVCIRRTQEEGKIAPGPPFGAAQLVGQRRRRIRVGRRVRHFEYGGDAALGSAAGSALQIFLVLQPRLAEVDLGVDDAGQDVQAGSIEPFGGARPAQIAERRDPAVPHADICGDAPHRRHCRAARDHQVVGRN